jgi:hypothetical protein
MNADKTFLDALTENVLGAVFELSNTLGAGFLEKVYHECPSSRVEPPRHQGYCGSLS